MGTLVNIGKELITMPGLVLTSDDGGDADFA